MHNGYLHNNIITPKFENISYIISDISFPKWIWWLHSDTYCGNRILSLAPAVNYLIQTHKEGLRDIIFMRVSSFRSCLCEKQNKENSQYLLSLASACTLYFKLYTCNLLLVSLYCIEGIRDIIFMSVRSSRTRLC